MESFNVNSTRPFNPPSGILTKLGVYITPTLVRNYAKYFIPRPHSFVYRKDQNFKISSLMTIFQAYFYTAMLLLKNYSSESEKCRDLKFLLYVNLNMRILIKNTKLTIFQFSKQEN